MCKQCQRCGGEIPLERSAIVETNFCVDCSKAVGGETVLAVTTDESGVVTSINHLRRVMPESEIALPSIVA